MMRHSSVHKLENIYQRESMKSIQQKYSPAYKRVHKSKNFQMVVVNPNLKRTVNKVEKKVSRAASNAGLSSYSSQLYPEKKKSVPNSLKDFRMSLSQKLHEQAEKFKSVRMNSQQQQFQFKENRKVSERLRTQEKERVMQQIQFKRKQRDRENNVKLRRTTSERSFVLETHKETMSMMKHSRQVRSRCDLKLTRQKQEETQLEHEYLVIKNRTNNVHKSYEQKYHKAFLTNTAVPKYKYPNLNDMLAIASKTLTSAKKKVELKPRNPSRPKLAALEHPKSKQQEKKMVKLEKELVKAKGKGEPSKDKKEKQKQPEVVEQKQSSNEVQQTTFMTAAENNPTPTKKEGPPVIAQQQTNPVKQSPAPEQQQTTPVKQQTVLSQQPNAEVHQQQGEIRKQTAQQPTPAKQQTAPIAQQNIPAPEQQQNPQMQKQVIPVKQQTSPEKQQAAPIQLKMIPVVTELPNNERVA